MKRYGFGALMAACSLGCLAAAPGNRVTLEIAGVRAASGQVLVALCGDAAASFPGSCITHAARADATAGTVSVTIEGVAAGRYAVQVFHDENGNGRPEIPPEGFAFGNDTPFPPTFAAAAVNVDGPTNARVTMTYIGTAAATPSSVATGAQADAVLQAGLTRMEVREHGLFGELHAQQGARGRPGLLLISGSEGGIDTMSRMAPGFASQGYAVLALAYWRAPGLPQTLENIPLEYFDRALTWLAARPEAKDAPLGVLGWSRGAEAALLIAARNPRVRAVVAVSPSGAVWQGLSFQQRRNQPAWTVKGKPLPALEPEGPVRLDSLAQTFVAAMGQMDRRPETAIAVESTRGGVLLISGGADNVWPATRFADRIMARLQAKGFRGNYMQLDYPQAGHAVFMGAPDGVLARSMSAPNPMMGGTPTANAAAWRDNWPKTLAFLAAELGSVR